MDSSEETADNGSARLVARDERAVTAGAPDAGEASTVTGAPDAGPGEAAGAPFAAPPASDPYAAPAEEPGATDAGASAAAAPEAPAPPDLPAATDVDAPAPGGPVTPDAMAEAPADEAVPVADGSADAPPAVDAPTGADTAAADTATDDPPAAADAPTVDMTATAATTEAPAPPEPAPPMPTGGVWGAPPAPAPPEDKASKAPWILLGLGVMVVLAVLVSIVVVTVARSGPGPEPARAEAEGFVRAWSANDVAGMKALIEAADAPVAADLDTSLGGLPVTRTTVTLSTITGQGDDRTANVAIELTSPDLPAITYTNTIPFHKVAEDTWRVVWSRTVIHPLLTGDRKFDRFRNWAPRGTLFDAAGQPIATVASSVTVVLHAAAVLDRPGLEQALHDSLGIDAATIDKAFNAAKASGRAPLKTISRTEFNQAKAAIYDIKGLTFEPTGGTQGIGGVVENLVVGKLGAANADQATALGEAYKEGDEIGTSGLQASQQKTLGGLPATDVRIIDGAGNVVQQILRVDGSPPTNVRTTVDRNVQQIAQNTLIAGLAGRRGAMVVMDRKGGIKALANSNTDGFNFATAQFAPGSTFKVVTAAALLAHGLGPDTMLTCPPNITVAGQPYQNFEGEAEANLTFTKAFAISCNTAFLGAADKNLNDAEMMKTVKQFGFGVDYDIGIPMKVRGSFPEKRGAIRSSQAIGQGDVLTNPVHMASVAAAAMTGRWLAPSFLADRPADLPAGEPLDPRVQQQLMGFMRANVESGSGTAAGVPGKLVYGKTGTAEFGTGPVLPTHAWYMGYCGDLAVALVIEGGGVGGREAAPIVGKFFAAAC